MTIQTWIFAVSWAVRVYQVCEGGVWIWAVGGWIGIWVGRKRRKERG